MFSYGSARRGPDSTPIVSETLAGLGAVALGLRMLFVSALVLSSGGCMVGPDFSSPSTPVAEKWLEAGNASVDTPNQNYRDWWTVFHDPVLDRLIETAYNQNLTLVSAGTRVLQARAELGVAIGEFYPQLQTGNGSVTYIPPKHSGQPQFPLGV